MKISVFGLTISSSWGNGHATPWRAILRALARRGCQVTFYEKDVEFYALRRDLASPEYCRLVFYQDWDTIRTTAVAEARSADAVIVTSYCPEGARIADEVLELGRPLRVYYDMDTPVTLKSLAAGPVDYLRRSQMAQFDLYLSFVGGPLLRALEEEYGVRRARPLYGCVDPATYRRVASLGEFECDLSYMGTYAPDRQEKLDALFLEPARRLPERQFVLAGTLYPWQWVWPENVRRFDHIGPREHPAFYSSSRMTLNLTRGEMARWGYCPSGRFFEAAACGTPLLSDRWNGLETFFTAGEEIWVVDSAAEVQAALGAADSDLHRVAGRARERTLQEHSGDTRAEQLLGYFEERAPGEGVHRSLELAS